MTNLTFYEKQKEKHFWIPSAAVMTGTFTLTELWANSAADRLSDIFIFFKGDNLHEILVKIRKNISKCHLLKILHSMLSIKS